jgi:hypothetical protein
MMRLSSAKPVDMGDTRPTSSTGFSTKMAHNRTGNAPLQIVIVVVVMNFKA